LIENINLEIKYEDLIPNFHQRIIKAKSSKNKGFTRSNRTTIKEQKEKIRIKKISEKEKCKYFIISLFLLKDILLTLLVILLVNHPFGQLSILLLGFSASFIFLIKKKPYVKKSDYIF